MLYDMALEMLITPTPAGQQLHEEEETAFLPFKEEDSQRQEETKKIHLQAIRTNDFQYLCSEVRAVRRSAGQDTSSDAVIEEAQNTEDYARLVNAILAGNYKPGMLIPEYVSDVPDEKKPRK